MTGVSLGVDVGSVRVGLAASDPHGLLASPVATLARAAASGPATDLTAIAAEVAERAATVIYVGLPRSLSGREGPAAQLAREYARALAAVVTVPVRLIDERFTSVTAQQQLRAAGVPGRKQRAVVDQIAAVLILQTALDQQRNQPGAVGILVEAVASSGA